jgi:hypothetical protein
MRHDKEHRHVNRQFRIALASSLLVLATAVPAAAAAPSNDDIATPTVIGALDYRAEIDTTEATPGATDPGYCDSGGDDFPSLATVWYRYTPAADGPLGAMTYGSDYPTTLHVGTSDGAGGIDVLFCNVSNARTDQSAIRWEAEAGVSYLIGVGADPFSQVNGGQLVFQLVDPGPKLAVSIDIDAEATLVRDGVAIVRGSFACTARSTWSTVVFVELYQTINKRSTFGFGFADISGCPSDGIPFEIEVSDDSPFERSDASRANAPLTPGPAAVQITYGACDVWGCAGESIDLELQLSR